VKTNFIYVTKGVMWHEEEANLVMTNKNFVYQHTENKPCIHQKLQIHFINLGPFFISRLIMHNVG